MVAIVLVCLADGITCLYIKALAPKQRTCARNPARTASYHFNNNIEHIKSKVAEHIGCNTLDVTRDRFTFLAFQCDFCLVVCSRQSVAIVRAMQKDTAIILPGFTYLK